MWMGTQTMRILKRTTAFPAIMTPVNRSCRRRGPAEAAIKQLQVECYF